jgi:hypothetical protein
MTGSNTLTLKKPSAEPAPPPPPKPPEPTKADKRAAFAALCRKRIATMAVRPGQAPIGEPYWIVMDLSHHHDVEGALQDLPRLFYRHPTEARAIAEAERLATTFKRGHRFGVFAAGPTFKIEPPIAED